MKLTTDNILRINNFLIDLLQECNKNNAEVELGTSLSNALTEMNKENETYEEMKKYEYACQIEMHPFHKYVEANTADEAIELIENEIEDSGFLQDLTKNDFHCDTADIIKPTPEYKEYCNKHKIKLDNWREIKWNYI